MHENGTSFVKIPRDKNQDLSDIQMQVNLRFESE